MPANLVIALVPLPQKVGTHSFGSWFKKCLKLKVSQSSLEKLTQISNPPDLYIHDLLKAHKATDMAGQDLP